MKKMNVWILMTGIVIAPFGAMAGHHHHNDNREVVGLVGNCIGLAAEVLRAANPPTVQTVVTTPVQTVVTAPVTPVQTVVTTPVQTVVTTPVQTVVTAPVQTVVTAPVIAPVITRPIHVPPPRHPIPPRHNPRPGGPAGHHPGGHGRR